MVLFLALLLLQAPPQQPARDRPLTGGSGTAVIAGRVVDSESGEPISGAIVQAMPTGPGLRLAAVETNERGGFRVANLPAGDYFMYVTPPELHATHVGKLVNTDVAGAMAGSRKPSFTLSEGEVRDDVVVALERALAIDGRVLDETGEPMAEVQLLAEPVDARTITASLPQHSDDRGHFRLFGLAAGTYRVCATPTTDWRMGPATAGEAVERPYVKTCYPSSPQGGGESVAVKPAGTPLLTIVMQRVRAFTISGTVTSESGAGDINVVVTRAGSDVPSIRTELQRPQGGRFITRGVPPGDYVVIAHGGREQRGLYDYRPTEQARARVRVDAADVTGVDLVTTKGATLVGRIVPEAPLPPGTSLQVRRSGVLAITPFFVDVRPATVGADLTFTLAGVHDEATFDVTGLPADWVLTAVRYRGTDVTDTPTKFASTREPSELVLAVSPRSARILLRPVDERGQVVSGTMVVLLTAKGERAIAPQFSTNAKPNAEGVIEMPAVRPGEYVAVALPALELRRLLTEPDRLTALRQSGTRIAVVAGERRAIDVLFRSLEGR